MALNKYVIMSILVLTSVKSVFSHGGSGDGDSSFHMGMDYMMGNSTNIGEPSIIMPIIMILLIIIVIGLIYLLIKNKKKLK